ncbi:MAG: tRNA preQ1(34) S-adenosylmethionine ribosyltransferase-isomerase QueA [Candidatus Aminicenantes bacterium]|nr:tRNA preQ1(34) S-adenosylmethionine ribosyltransferase-isomerase QueA [Candidatus Aminicenantes bacterium]
MRVQDFDYDLPAELIAQRPLERRDASRMMVVRLSDGAILHRAFRDLPGFFEPGDLLVLNDTKVIPAKAWGRKGEAVVEFLFLQEKSPGVWDVLCKPARRVRPGETILFSDDFRAEVVEKGEGGRRTLRFDNPDVLGRLKDVGFAPLPPYIKRRKADSARREEDLARYQTVFADREGAIAAPTAGLHFTPEMLARLEGRGCRISRLTLHVGLATFQPMRVERLENHNMPAETYMISDQTAAEIGAAKAEGRPVAAVGTTVVRALESAPLRNTGTTSLFIYPGFEFRVVTRLLTNFHLPRSTLLVLVSAFAGRELILKAYREAVRERYRFFSYGDCMLIL